MLKIEERNDWPHSPRKLPIHYGWIILFLAGLGTACSAPGQTIGVSAFTDPLIGAMSLARDQLSLAYMIGTLASSLLLTRAGRFYDRAGARVVGPLAALALGVVLVGLSFCDRIAGGLSTLLGTQSPLVPAAVMVVGFFLLRFTGQGVLTLVCRNMVMKWFEDRRGLANAILGGFLVVGFSLAPPTFDSIIDAWGWAWAWRLIAAVVGVGFAAVAVLTFRDNPEDCGLSADAGMAPPAENRLFRIYRDFTLPEAKRDYAFWVFCLPVSMGALFITAFSFHVASFFENAGMTEDQGFAIFFPMSIVSVVVNLFSGWLSDRVRLKWLLLAFNATLGGGMALTAYLDDGLVWWCLVLMLGIFQGFFGLLMTVTWPKFYGRTHLGAISGLQMAFTVAASAVGPWLFSLSLAHLGSYRVASLICAGIMGILFVAAFFAENPQEKLAPPEA
jgi:MFS family permease